MSEMIAVLKIMPESPELDLVDLETRVRAHIAAPVKCESVVVKPIAFGLKALMVTVLAEDDGSGAIDKLEESLADVAGVESVQVTEAGRL